MCILQSKSLDLIHVGFYRNFTVSVIASQDIDDLLTPGVNWVCVTVSAVRFNVPFIRDSVCVVPPPTDSLCVVRLGFLACSERVVVCLRRCSEVLSSPCDKWARERQEMRREGRRRG